jgi:hypothetical protein
MDFIISQNQLNVIVEQNSPNDITDNLRKLYDFTRELIDKSMSVWGLNAKFLITWGAALGGMILPLKIWLETQNFEITKEQTFLLLLGIACNYYYDNSDFIRKVMQKIKDEGLLDIFKKLYQKSEELKNGLVEFLRSLKIFGDSMTSIMSYAFVLPILGDIYQMVGGEDIFESAKIISQRIAASGVVLIVGHSLTSFIEKILRLTEGKL